MFIVVVVLLLFNMLIAIIMEAYQTEKKKAESATSLATQVKQMYRRHREYKKGLRVRLNDVWNYFSEEFEGDEDAMLESTRMITPKFLVENVPNMKAAQAERTLLNSMKSHRKSLEDGATEQEVKDKVKEQLESVFTRSETIMAQVRYIKDRVDFYDRLQVPGDPEFEYYFGEKGLSPEEQADDSIAGAVTAASAQIGDIFFGGLSKIEALQDAFEKQQNELHEMISEMQIMVGQQARSVALISEAVAQGQGGAGDDIQVLGMASTVSSGPMHLP